ncbi:MAG: hypothetical protein HUU21_32770, partial [Polyangiaceae bacterium]|nr:hypothetical protein [Polyangiaceae bacterium]
MKKASLYSLLMDRSVLSDLQSQASHLESMVPSSQREALDLLMRGKESGVSEGALTATEAIILTTGRPALLVVDGKWEPIKIPDLKKRVDGAAAALELAIPRVGRVEILGYDLDYVGTGWMVDEDIMVTNRHVASLVVVLQSDPARQLPDAEVQNPGRIVIGHGRLDEVDVSRQEVEREAPFGVGPGPRHQRLEEPGRIGNGVVEDDR